MKCLNNASTSALVLKIFKEITSKVDVCMKAFHAKLTMSNEAISVSAENKEAAEKVEAEIRKSAEAYLK